MLDEMTNQIFPSVMRAARPQTDEPAGGRFRYKPKSVEQLAEEQMPQLAGMAGLAGQMATGAGSGLPFMAPYVPGVSGMRMVGTGGMPSYGGLTTRQIFG